MKGEMEKNSEQGKEEEKEPPPLPFMLLQATYGMKSDLVSTVQACVKFPWSPAHYSVELKLRPNSVCLLECSIIVLMRHTLVVLRSDNPHQLVCGNQ